MEKKAQILDADYTVEDGEVTVRAFCKTEEGKDLLAVDENFRPYFYAVPEKDVEELKEKVEDERPFETEDGEEELEIEGLEIKEMVDGNEKTEVLKVSTTIPANVTKLKNKLWDLEGTKECREFDIPFYRRYMIDKGLRPNKWYSFSGEVFDPEDMEQGLRIESIIEKEQGSFDWEMLAFDLEVYENEIIMASMYAEDFEKLLTTEEIDEAYVEVVEDEKEIIERFVEIIEERNVDILTGYNTDEYDFDKLRERSNEHNITLSLGRNGERMKFNRRGRFKGARLKGRMHLDLYPFIEHVLAPGIDSETLDLDSVAEEMLGRNKDEMSWEDMKKSWENKEGLSEFARYALKDSELAFELAEEIVPQVTELSRITGLIPFDTCRLTYGQLTENFLIREAHLRDMLVENRPSQDSRRKRQRQGSYSGGFVYTPEEGLYEDIVTLDFRSLYPTVMVAHNFSPDTLNVEDCGDEFQIQEFDYSFCQDEEGFFPELIENLVEDRYKIKSEMKEKEKDSAEYKALDNEQQAKKILANSFYGYLGYNGARWYSREAAEATTYMGREYIEDTIEMAEEDGYEIVYGDSLDYSRQIVVRDPQGQVRFVKIGEFVENVGNPRKFETLAWDEDEEEVVFQAVERAIKHHYEGDLIRFDTTRGRTKVTPQHSVYKYEGDNFQLADARELENGDHLVSLSEVPKVPASYSEGDTIDFLDFNYQTSELRAYKDKKRFPAELGICPYCENEYYLSSHVHSEHEERKTKLNQVTSEHSYIGYENARVGKIPRFWELSSEFAWVLGFYCGDGSASVDGKYMLSFGGQDKENIAKIKEFFDSVLDEELSIIEDVDYRTGNKMYYYRIQRKPIVNFFVEGLNSGIGSEGKRVPNVIINGDKELKRSFIEGYFEADGSREKDHDSRYNSESMRFSTKSSSLANQVHYILKQLELGENCYGRKINDVSFKYRQDKPQIRSIRNTAPLKSEFGEKSFTPAKINKIEKVNPTRDKVYDLEVEGEHNFVDAEGLLLVHNTDSVFLKKDNIKQNIHGFLDKVNSDLPKFMELEFEGFFKRGFFTSKDSGEGAKKKYALIDEDGKMKITGFEQVRRDWSPIAKRTQKEVLRKVLENKVDEAFEVAKDNIEALKEGEVPIEELKIYTTLTKPPEEYDSTSPHVEAAKKAKKRGKEIPEESTITYVITATGASISDQAEILEYAESYDSDYYIENQVIPAVLRVLKVFGYTEGQLKGKGRQSGLGRFG